MCSLKNFSVFCPIKLIREYCGLLPAGVCFTGVVRPHKNSSENGLKRREAGKGALPSVSRGLNCTRQPWEEIIDKSQHKAQFFIHFSPSRHGLKIRWQG